ncbi:molecular chaperone HtpG [Vandammella animalimorsus]|uniref:Chaperone protein HtpG n=1 Tax=Vandammella animalimorsus TaxID=2029117 RepID=A0A2A2ARP8_9BURK|nr:molecular chaperone HtpG [Vandammella animalimorsus]PAT40382.1 molecular chaperone HtpG [Vandammella animalimorsus]
MSTKKHAFQAEVAQVLHLVTHSLYSNPEIFLRELISNAADACDKLRFEALNDSALYEGDAELRVRIHFDEQAKTLTIEDNGIGMSLQEAIDNLGTIAKSGTRDFASRLSGDAQADAQLIGQFGVGFYSAFIVAEQVVVQTRRAGLPASEGVRWSSQGTGDFEVETVERAQRGTSITLHLRDSASEFLNGWKLRSLINKYSDHISLPVQMQQEQWQEAEQEGQPGAMVKTGEWETVNQASALWARPKKDISAEQYIEFYKNLSHDFEAPLAWSHNKVEGATEYTQLLYLPAKAPHDLWNRDKQAGLKLYVKRVFIMNEADALLPSYLRFVSGVIDAADLPLNVSREILQESRDVRAIRDGNTRRVLGMLESLAEEDAAAAPAQPTDQANQAEQAGDVTDVVDKNAPAADAAQPQGEGKYARFYAQFGAVLKEGLGEDFAHRERIARLLRYASTHSDSPSVGLADYKARMKDGQKAIYYITADSLAAAKSSPQLELFRKKGIEVLFMTDRVDEWAMGFVHEFDGTPLQSIAKGAVDLGELQDEAERQAAQAAAEQYQPLVERLKTVLKGKAEDVRVTTRLVDSPACLVVQDGQISNQFARLLKQAGQALPETLPVLEVNPSHALVQRLQAAQDAQDAQAEGGDFEDLAHVLFDQALLAEGGLPDDPAAYVQRIHRLLLAPAG